MMIRFLSVISSPLLYSNFRSAEDKSIARSQKTTGTGRGVSRKENLTRMSSWGRPTGRNEDGGRGECRVHGVPLSLSLSVGRTAPPRHRNFTSITRSLGTNGRERSRGRGREGERERAARRRRGGGHSLFTSSIARPAERVSS